MKAKICRRYYAEQTEGELQVWNEEGELVFECKTLELAWKDNEKQVSCIPEGTYNVVPRTSPKYKEHLHVTDVPNRDFILIHHGNYAGSMNPNTGHSDIKGCVLVGQAHIDINNDGIKDITASKATMKKLMAVAGNGFELEVTQ